MDRLWAPWRMPYIQGIDAVDDTCVFCKDPNQDDESDHQDLVLHRGTHCIVMLNKYPYTNGHLMVIPCRHTADITMLAPETMTELWNLVRHSVTALRLAFKADGFNIGMNLGRVAGAGIDHHLHMHVVPRWNGDVNFMSVTAETKVISQGLHDSFDALKPHFKSVTGNS